MVKRRDMEISKKLQKLQIKFYNKLSVPLALAIFDESTSAAICSYFPEHNDASSFLKLFNSWWIISNAKYQFDTKNRLGNIGYFA